MGSRLSASSLDLPANVTDAIAEVSWVSLAKGEDLCALPSANYRLTVVVPRDGAKRAEMLIWRPSSAPVTYRASVSGWLVVIVLKSIGLFRLLRGPFESSHPRRTDLGDILPRDDVDGLRARIAKTSSPGASAELVMNWIAGRSLLDAVLPPAALHVAEATSALADAPSSDAHLATVAVRLGRCERQLEKDFATWIGLKVAPYRRLVRHQAVAHQVLVANGVPATSFIARSDLAGVSRFSSSWNWFTYRLAQVLRFI